MKTRGIPWLWPAFVFYSLLAGAGADPFPVAASLELNGQSETQLVVKVEVPHGYSLYADQFQVEVLKPAKIIPLSLPVPQGEKGKKGEKREKDAFPGDEKKVYTQSFTAVYLIENSPKDIIDVNIRLQGCDQNTCFLPVSKQFRLQFPRQQAISDAKESGGNVAAGASIPWLDNIRQHYRVVAARSGYINAHDFSTFLDVSAEGGLGDPVQKAWQVGTTWLAVLLIIFGGLVLNLTPCVLPLIPVNLAIIGAGVHAGSASRGFLRGTVYGLGIALAYGSLGLLSVLTGAQFGSINASPWFNLGVAFLFLILGLALLDLIIIDFSRFQSRLRVQSGGALFIFVLGFISALLAGACVAPVVIAVLLLAADLYMQGQNIGLILPFLLGMGMALPWPFAGAGLSFLPKPGKWMLHIKHIFAVVIFLTAFYYFFLGSKLLYTRYSIPMDSRVTHSELSQNARLHPEAQALGKHCGQVGDNWLALPEGLAAANKEKKPILVYFWASWCKSCQAMNATAFKDENIRQKMRNFICVKFQAENPQDQEVKQVLREFNVIGLPTFVILKSK